MGLKQSVVIVNEFSMPLPGGRGSRGATPGAYVDRYMARPGATEALAPIQRRRTDDFIMRYMAREEAVEVLGDRISIKSAMRDAQGKGGVAFGYGQVSLSDEQLRAASKDIQSLFEAGHTVMKTVISFDHEYLKKHGVVPPDFTPGGRGSYRGQLDQMKLRGAIMHGVDRLGAGPRGYDDLRFVGVVQVDTEHVHAHLAMVDAGPGRRARNGRQLGKLTDHQKSRLRRGVDAWLDEKSTMKHLSSAVGYERRNVITFIKRWALHRIRNESLPQFLLATLPADRSLWRAGSNDERMRKPNEILTELVNEQLAQPGSPMPAAMASVLEYANTRRTQENLDKNEWTRLVETGREQIIERAANGVYQMLRALPERELTVRTPMLEVMGMDYTTLALASADSRQEGTQEADDLVSFGFRLRSYSSRLKHHKRSASTYSDLARQWERADEAKVAPADSRPLYDFYRTETIYHQQLMSKYQHFLPYLDNNPLLAGALESVNDYGQRLLALQALRADATLARMKDPAAAEELGRAIYDQGGGHLMTQGRAGRGVLDARISAMRTNYASRRDELVGELAGSGMVLTSAAGVGLDLREGGDAPLEVAELRAAPGRLYPFESVKSLDLHHLGYDFTRDVPLGQGCYQRFVSAAASRRSAVLGAMGYLDASGQSGAIADLPVGDISKMHTLAIELSRQAPDVDGLRVLPSRIATLRAQAAQKVAGARSGTTSLDADLASTVAASIRTAATAPVELAELENAAAQGRSLG